MQVIGDQLYLAIDSAFRIGIFFHTYPDGDCLGSAFALRQIILDNFNNKSVRVIGDRKGKLFFLGLQGISTQKALPDNFKRKGSLAIVVDCGKKEKVDCSHLLEKFEQIAIIDHHRPFDESKILPYSYDDLYIKDENKVSCAEVILDGAQSNDLHISPKTASFLYCGVFGDSQGFTNPNVTADTFESARSLIELGADVTTINQNIEKKDLIHEKLRSQLIIKGKQKDKYFYSILDRDLIDCYKKRFNTETRLFYVVHSINIRGTDVVAIFFKYINKLVINIHKTYNHPKILEKGYMALRNNGKSYSYVRTFEGEDSDIEDELQDITENCLC